MNKRDRKTFLKNYGVFYALLGGTFGAYRTADEAFQKARLFRPYHKLNFVDADLEFFAQGFARGQKKRVAMQLTKAKAEKGNKALLAKYNYEFQNFVYDSSEVSPIKTHCEKCRKVFNKGCTCKGVNNSTTKI